MRTAVLHNADLTGRTLRRSASRSTAAGQIGARADSAHPQATGGFPTSPTKSHRWFRLEDLPSIGSGDSMVSLGEGRRVEKVYARPGDRDSSHDAIACSMIAWTEVFSCAAAILSSCANSGVT